MLFFKTGTNTIILFALRKSRIPTTNEARFADMQEWLKEANFTKAKDTYEDFSELFREYCAFRNFDTLELEALFSNALSQDSKLLQSQYTQSYQEQINKEKQDYNKKSDKYKKANPFTPSQSLQEYVRDKEAEKFLYFCYCHDSTPLLIKSPQDNATQKKFLGYEWSSKKGKEGIQILASSANLTKDIQTPLYNPKDRYDTSKLNTQILSHFLEKMQGLSCLDSSPLAEAQNDNTRSHSEAIAEESNNTQSLKPNHIQIQNSIPKELEPYAFRARLVDMLDFEKVEFNKAISLNPIRRLRNTPHHSEYSRHSEGALATEESFFLDSSDFRSQNDIRPFANCKYELVRLGEVALEIQTAKRPNGGVDRYDSGALSLGGEHIDNTSGYVKLDSPKYVPIEFYEKFKTQNKGIVKKDDILLCKDGALTGKVALVRDEFTNQKVMINEHIFLIRCDSEIKQKYLFFILHSNIGQNLLKSKITGSAQGGLNQTNLKSIQIPLPPIEIQKQIVEECEKVEKQSSTIKTSIEKYRELIKAILAKCAITESSANNASIQEILTQLNTLESSLDFDLLFECLETTNADSKDISGVALNMTGFSHSKGGQRMTEESTKDISGYALNMTESRHSNLSTRHSEALAEESLLLHSKESYSFRHSEALAEESKNPNSSNIESKILEPLNLKALLDSLPTPPPQGWERVRLGDIAQIIAGQSPESRFYNERGNGLLFFQGKKDFGGKYLKNSNIYTSQITKESIKNDILMSVRAPVGDVNLNPYEKICIGRGLAAIRAKNFSFLYYCMAHNKELFMGKMGMAFESISMPELKSIQIPLPPLESQDQIINVISKIEEKKSLMDSSLESLEDKKSKILKSALEST